MRRCAIVLAALLATLPGSVAAQRAAMEAYQAQGARASRPTATISYGPDAQEIGDLRVPAGRGPFPVVVIIHGGCWLASMDTHASTGGLADALVARGFATWNIEYRRIGNAGGGWPGTFHDVAAATDKLAEIGGRYHLDLSRVTIVGHSAGAHLALWVASRERLPSPWNRTRVHPSAVVAIDGPGALAPFVGADQQVCGQPVIEPFMGGTPAAHPTEYAIASPSEHLPLGVRQLFVTAALGEFMQPYIAASRTAGDPVEVLAPANANHFDIVTPATANGAAVVDFIATRALLTVHPSSGH